MKDFKRILVRIRWRRLCEDILKAVCWIAAIPAVILFYRQNFGGLQIASETVLVYYLKLLAGVSIPGVLIAWMLNLFGRKLALGYMYVAPEERILAKCGEMLVIRAVDSKGKNFHIVRLKKKAIEQFVVNFLIRYDLLGEENITSKYDHCKLENWTKEYFEWVLDNYESK